ncbi:LuxR C-terminal-related transcriptional regulator [Skermania sp. ID1734]|uniref:LuxR C-terminal-related transcriptional regulator n=1 Tax=Skermania sp. ID1734 TaxID=2597516 RepID=UPI00163D59EF|nr:LuxR C-terminal-related transcriptional regulator [Skermania sp. ID1734]
MPLGIDQSAVFRSRFLDEFNDGVRLAVVRGPEGSGKSTVIDAWIARLEPRTRVVRIPEPVFGCSAAEYLNTVLRGLRGTGSPQDASFSVDEAASAIDGDLVMVLDQLGNCVDAPAVGARLLELLRRCSELSVIVETRAAIFDAVELAAVDGHVEIGPEQLCFTVEEIIAVHRTVGIELGSEAAERLHRLINGEVAPTVLAARLAKQLGYPVVDLRGGPVPEYLARLSATAEAVLDRNDVSPWRKVVLEWAPLRTINPDTVPPALEQLGLLQRRSRDSLVEYPAALRMGLLQIARRELDDDVAETLDALAASALAEDNATEATLYACDAENWTVVGEIFEKHFARIIDEDLAGAVRVLQAFPDEHRESFPVVQAARSSLIGLGEMPLVVADLPTTDADLAAIATSEEAMSIATRATIRALGLRRLGYYGEAVELAERIHRILDDVFEMNKPHLDAQRSMLRLTLATTFQLAGRYSSAATQLLYAFRSGSSAVRRKSAGVLALNWALQGDMPRTVQWLRAGADQAHPPGRWGTSMRLPGDCAQALCHLERFDLDAARQVLDNLGEPEFREERWALMAYVRALWSLLCGEPTEGLDWLDTMIQQHRHYYVPESLGHRLITAVRVDLHLAAGDANAAVAVLDNVQARSGPALLVARARTELLTGRPDAALAAASGATHSEETCARVRIDAMLIEAAAHVSGGDDDAATQCWRTACRIAERCGCYLPFALLGSAHRDRLSELTGVSAPALAALQPPVFPAGSLAVVRLTPRESELLQFISQGLTLTAIAKNQFVSPNTVKTQLRSLYRKLGVNTREQALAQAARLHLLDHADMQVS